MCTFRGHWQPLPQIFHPASSLGKNDLFLLLPNNLFPGSVPSFSFLRLNAASDDSAARLSHYLLRLLAEVCHPYFD